MSLEEFIGMFGLPTLVLHEPAQPTEPAAPAAPAVPQQ
jgi:hypothetical protein